MEGQWREEEFLSCSGSRRFAREMVNASPFADLDHAVRSARDIWFNRVDVKGWLEGFSAHPEIGSTSKSISQCSKEKQSAALASATDYAMQELVEWNARYKEKFGYVFLICASGRGTPEILAELKKKNNALGNSMTKEKRCILDLQNWDWDNVIEISDDEDVMLKAIEDGEIISKTKEENETPGEYWKVTTSMFEDVAKILETKDNAIEEVKEKDVVEVHITQGGLNGASLIVSWVTQDEPGSSKVLYGTSEDKLEFSAEGKVNHYKYYNYTSGFIHHCTLRKLKHDTKYYYEIGIGHTTRKFWFITPPQVGPDVPYTFGLIGDLGQSYDSNRTLTHYEMNPTKGQTVLFVGDLSYADNYPDHDNVRWDTWGRFVERSTTYQPWIWTAGNHEIDFAPELERVSNIAYNIVNGLCMPISDPSAPVYITIGDGGNLEGLATNMTEPQPKYSAYREASFGHAIFDIKNRTHAYYGWHRNQDGFAVEADKMWFYNRFWNAMDESTSAE